MNRQTNQTSPPRPANTGGCKDVLGLRRSPISGAWVDRPSSCRAMRGGERGVGGPQASHRAPPAPSTEAAPSSRRRSSKRRLYARRLPGVANGLSPMQSIPCVGQARQVRSRSSFAPALPRNRRGKLRWPPSRAVTCKASRVFLHARDDRGRCRRRRPRRLRQICAAARRTARRRRGEGIRSRVQSATAAAVSAAIAAAQQRDQKEDGPTAANQIRTQVRVHQPMRVKGPPVAIRR